MAICQRGDQGDLEIYLPCVFLLFKSQEFILASLGFLKVHFLLLWVFKFPHVSVLGSVRNFPFRPAVWRTSGLFGLWWLFFGFRRLWVLFLGNGRNIPPLLGNGCNILPLLGNGCNISPESTNFRNFGLRTYGLTERGRDAVVGGLLMVFYWLDGCIFLWMVDWTSPVCQLRGLHHGPP